MNGAGGSKKNRESDGIILQSKIIEIKYCPDFMKVIKVQFSLVFYLSFVI